MDLVSIVDPESITRKINNKRICIYQEKKVCTQKNCDGYGNVKYKMKIKRNLTVLICPCYSFLNLERA